MAQWLNYLKKIRPYNIQKGFRYLKHYGLREFLVRLSERMETGRGALRPLVEKHKASREQLEKQRARKWDRDAPS